MTNQEIIEWQRQYREWSATPAGAICERALRAANNAGHYGNDERCSTKRWQDASDAAKVAADELRALLRKQQSDLDVAVQNFVDSQARGAHVALDLTAAQKRIAELEQSREELRKACAQVLGYNEEAWPSHGNSPLAVCAALALRVQRIKELEAALRLFKGAAVPCCTTIDPRGYQWCEAYLDQALTGEPR